MDARTVLGDAYTACVISSISYRVYAFKELQPLGVHSTESVPGSSLRRAEVVLRRELQKRTNQIFISVGRSGKELWVYDIQASAGQPTNGSTSFMEKDETNGMRLYEADQLLSALVENAETVAQGVFLPPFTSTNLTSVSHHPLAGGMGVSSSDNTAGSRRLVVDDGLYGPLIRAIELRCLDTLLKGGDHEQYEAFGTKSALSTGDGSILRVVPVLNQEGSLTIRTSCQNAVLIPLPMSNILSCAPLVWLLPQGKPCRITSTLQFASSVESPNQARARALHKLLTNYFVTNITLNQLEKSMWLRVTNNDTGEMLWPVILIRATALTTGGCDWMVTGNGKSSNRAQTALERNFLRTPKNYEDSYIEPNAHVMATSGDASSPGTVEQFRTVSLATRPLSKIDKPDPFSALVDTMAAIRQELSSEHDPNVNPTLEISIEPLLQTMNPPIAPPSSPRATINSASYLDLHALARDTSARQMVGRSSATLSSVSHSSTAPVTSNNSSVTSSGMGALFSIGGNQSQSISTTPIAFQVYPTPTYHTPGFTPGYQTPSATTPNPDFWVDIGDNDEDEVGDADFNFFDLPLGADADTEVKDEEQGPRLVEVSEDEQPINTLPENEKIVIKENDASVPVLWARTRFSSINLHGSNELDSKYNTGGRFFVERSPSKESGESSASSEDESDGENVHFLEVRKHLKRKRISSRLGRFSSGREGSESDSDTEESHDSDYLIDADSDTELRVAGALSSGAMNEDNERAWFQSISRENTEYLPIDDSKFESFRLLLPQIVWDGGTLKEVVDAPVIGGELTVAPQHAIERLKSLYKTLNQCSMIYQMDTSKPASIPMGSRMPSIQGKGSLNNTGSSSTNSGPSTPRELKSSSPLPGTIAPTTLQLFSPPLVAVFREKYALRARISILRFWRLLSLEPPPTTGTPKRSEGRGIDVSEKSGSALASAADGSVIHSPKNAAGNASPNDRESKTSISLILVTLDSPAVTAGARRIIEGITQAYEDCKLGSVHLPTFGSVDQGLMQIQADLSHTSGDAVGDLFENGCAQLRTQLQAYNDQAEGGESFSNLMVLMSYPPSSLRGGTYTAIVPFQIAQGAASLLSTFPNCQWMLCSLDLLVSRWDHDKETSTFEFERLALLLYSRFPHFPRPFRLAALAPKTSGLQFTPESPQFLMEDEPVLHVAYLVVEGRWCLTSWTDQWSNKKKVEIFKLADSNDKSLQYVFGEILKTAMAISLELRDHRGWRFSITKCGPMSNEEFSLWTKVFLPNVPVVLMDTPYPRGIRSENSLKKAVSIGSDVVGVRGVQHAKAETEAVATLLGKKLESPSAALAADCVIIDENDEVYGISIGVGLSVVSTYVSALAKGFLVRLQPNELLTLEVRLLGLHALQLPVKTVMSRVIGQYRRLACLSEYTGVSTETTLIPWHILALTKVETAALKLNMF